MDHLFHRLLALLHKVWGGSIPLHESCADAEAQVIEITLDAIECPIARDNVGPRLREAIMAPAAFVESDPDEVQRQVDECVREILLIVQTRRSARERSGS